MASSSAPITPSKNATATARKLLLAKLAQQKKMNEETAKYYAAGVMGMIAIFAVFHWARYLYSCHASKQTKSSKVMRAQISFVR